MYAIVIAASSVTAIGIICAIVLGVASRLMAVKVDERVAAIHDILPGVNCGACGYPGCSGYAEALILGDDVSVSLCAPGGAEVIHTISAILGLDTAAVPGGFFKKNAVVHCGGDCNAQQKKMDYKGGIQSCAAAKQLFGGEGACAFGCLGYGDCQTVCPVKAICVQDGLARIMHYRCTSCGLCVKACPNNIISIRKTGLPVAVLCKNLEKGAVTRKKCANGCIACGKCVRECPEQAIVMEDNLAVINYEKCTGCKHCAEVCIAKCINPMA